jgi:maleylpyruvate isomerase
VPDEILDAAQIANDIDALDASQRALDEHLAHAGDVDPAAPSLLPGWTIGHLLTHIARNADSMFRMAEGLPQYWHGFESRTADIELGATRSWAELVDDVRVTNAAATAHLRAIADWSGEMLSIAGSRPKSFLPSIRQREIEIHRVDLGLGYGFADMPAAMVRTDLARMTMAWSARQPMGMTQLPRAVLALPEHDRLAWLWGRLDMP